MVTTIVRRELRTCSPFGTGGTPPATRTPKALVLSGTLLYP